MPERRGLERFDIASELDGIPPTYNPRGYVWTAPRYSLITHATFRAHRTKPDEIDLHAERPTSPEGRVLRFKVPFIHTKSGTFFRQPQKKYFIRADKKGCAPQPGPGAVPNDHREKRPVTLRRTLEAEPFFELREALFCLLWLAALRRAVGLHSSSNEMDSSPGGKITMCAWR
jgi:hypothetical protein